MHLDHVSSACYNVNTMELIRLHQLLFWVLASCLLQISRNANKNKMLFYFYFHLLLQDICLSENKICLKNKNTEENYMLMRIMSEICSFARWNVKGSSQAWWTAFVFDEKLWKLSLMVLQNYFAVSDQFFILFLAVNPHFRKISHFIFIFIPHSYLRFS